MKKVHVKTSEERKIEEEDSGLTSVLVKHEGKYALICERCEIAYFGEDLIFKTTKGKTLCPNIRNNWWRKRKCLQSLMHVYDKDDFDKFYRILT